MTREARLGRALVLLILAVALQPLFVLGCAALPDDGVAPPARGTILFSQTDFDDDDALDVIFGEDPVVIAGVVALPIPQPRADVLDLAPAPVPPRVADAADHPPRCC